MSKFSSVLLIDDDEITNHYNKRLIKKLDLAESTFVSLNGQEALDFLESKEIPELPELIFLDINMPLMNGFEFMEEYRKRGIAKGRTTVLMMLSTSLNEGDHDKASSYTEINEFINKPLTKEKLLEIKEKYLD